MVFIRQRTRDCSGKIFCGRRVGGSQMSILSFMQPFRNSAGCEGHRWNGIRSSLDSRQAERLRPDTGHHEQMRSGKQILGARTPANKLNLDAIVPDPIGDPLPFRESRPIAGDCQRQGSLDCLGDERQCLQQEIATL